MKRNIIITGGAGFIGSHVVRLFVTKYPDYHIINLDKLTYAGNLANLKDIENAPNYTFVKGDICDFELIQQLMEKYPKARILLFGRGEQESKYFAEWSAQHAACVNVGAQLESMHQELILMSHLDVMISMDSSNMHLASLTNTPVVSIWGATHPYAGFMGWGQSEDNAVQIPLDCRPCSIFGQKPCLRGDYACMRNIAPETIVEKVEMVLRVKSEK